ncbi:ATP-binding protein [Bacillus sp. 3255]|uniref:sensor histidine kinase n=1 Tax=Bacillus sp. 3255 TaxID=2817904 RepID=UPI002863A5DA|nr:ATP-binding protein [Bacillus sp. 3255]MDR6882099.1 two-component system sensor histidine kinase ComP [Bacillus sp. 3255]
MNHTMHKALLFFCLLCIQVWFLFLTFQYTFYGIQLQRNDQKEWSIQSFQIERVGSELGLQIGDKVVRVNDRDPNENKIVSKWATLEQAHSVTVARGDQTIRVSLNEDVQPAFDFISLFGEIFSLCVSFIIFWKIPQSRAARLLSLVFLSVGVIFMCIPPSARGDSLARVLVSDLVMLLPVVFAQFLTLFFNERCGTTLPVRYFRYVYAGMLLIFIGRCLYFTPIDTYGFYQFDYSSVVIAFLIGFLFNVGILIYVFIRFRRDNVSVQALIKIVWGAFFISTAPLVFLSFVPILIRGVPLVKPLYTGYCVALFPLAFTYMIVSKQWFDVHILLRRIIYTTLISMVPSFLIVLMLALIFGRSATIGTLAFSFLFILTVISFLLYLLEYFVTKLDAVMFPKKFYLQLSLKKIARNLRTITSFRELKDIILVDIVNTLNIHGGAIVIHYPQGMETIGEGEMDLHEVEQYIREDRLDDANYAIFVINQNEEYACYLVTGRKKMNTSLSLEERQWLSLIISYLAVSLENIYLIRKLTMKLHELASQIPNEEAGQDVVWLRKSLFELQEQERYRLATDLHDTTMQDILLVRRRLVSFIDNNEDRQQVLHAIKHLDLVNESLRQSCFELHPHLLQNIGLIQTIQATLDLDIGLNEYETHFQYDEVSIIERLDMDMKKHLFRIFQELMHNAKKHAQAAQVIIKLAVIEKYVILSYKDNGVGLDPQALARDKRLHAIANSGLGLEQMKSRVLHLNGHMDLQSEKGNGLELTIRIPIPAQEGRIS